MRRRIVALTTAVAAVAVLVLGVPLVLVGRHQARTDARARVDREANAIAFALGATFDRGEPVTTATLAPFARSDRFVVVRDASGTVTRAGTRPTGRTVAAHVTTDGARITLLADAHEVGDRSTEIALAVAGFGLVAIATAAGTGWLLARRVTAPLDELADASARLGAGDFSVSLPRHSIRETDAVADALETSGARIDTLVQAERDFSANASHQLRSPLTALRMRLEELADHPDAATTRAEAEAALEQADRLDETITDLLALARQGRIGDAVVVDLEGLVRERVAAWAPAAAHAGRTIGWETPIDADGTTTGAGADADPGGAVTVRIHPGGLTQALVAVLDNALRHGTGAVTVSVARHRVDVEVVVADEGPGLSPAVAATAFERHVSESGGTGVGLALARTLVHADGGRVDVLPGAPTRFRLRFPPA